MSRQALVTGATGGLGRALTTALLRAGYSVRATGRDQAAGSCLERQGAAFVAAELTDPTAAPMLMADIEVVFHAAALASPWGPRSAFEATNVEATRRLVDAAKAAGADAFVFISTPSVYAEPRDRLQLTETSPLAARFANAYVATKHAAEQLVLAANGPRFATMVLRPQALVGPHDRVLLPRLLRVARRGWAPLFRGGSALTDLTDVRDAASAARLADQQRATVGGQVFNITGGAPLSVAEIFGAVFDGLGLAPRLVHVPYPVAAVAAQCAERLCAALPGRPEPPITPYSLDALAYSRTFDLTAARTALGWTPSHAPRDAIARAIAAWRDHAPV